MKKNYFNLLAFFLFLPAVVYAQSEPVYFYLIYNPLFSIIISAAIYMSSLYYVPSKSYLKMFFIYLGCLVGSEAGFFLFDKKFLNTGKVAGQPDFNYVLYLMIMILSGSAGLYLYRKVTGKK